MKKTVMMFIAFIAFSLLAEEEIIRLALSPATGMTRADLYYLKPAGKVEGILVLCPGHNGNGKHYLEDAKWRDYARRNRLGLVGLSFASGAMDPKSSRFYYYAENGSGKLLLEGLKKIYRGNLPLFLYGFSGGAHFTARFVEWKPDRVGAWCAYSAGWWDKPKKSASAPPGIVACGRNDERFQASLNYFWDGREAGKPWLWIGLKETGHTPSAKLDLFVMAYFEAVLREKKNSSAGIWLDIYEKKETGREDAAHRPCAAGWLPHRELYSKWLELAGETPER